MQFLRLRLVGCCALPGLKSETWGTRPLLTIKEWTRLLWDGLRGGAFPDAGLADRGGNGRFVFIRLQGGAPVGWNLVQGVEAKAGRGVAAAEEGGEEAGSPDRLFLIRGRGGDGDESMGPGMPGGGAPGLALRLQFGALLAPVAPAVMPGEGVKPAVFNALFEGEEADGGGKVESGGGQHSGHQQGALDIEIAHQQIGHEAARHALDGEEMEPAPAPGHQGQGGRQKEKGQEDAGRAQPGRAAGTRAHPGEADSAQPKGQEKGGEAETLQQQVGEPGAEEAGPIARGLADGGVERGVRGVVGGEREDGEEGGQQQHQPQKDVQGTAARGR